MTNESFEPQRALSSWETSVPFTGAASAPAPLAVIWGTAAAWVQAASRFERPASGLQWCYGISVRLMYECMAVDAAEPNECTQAARRQVSLAADCLESIGCEPRIPAAMLCQVRPNDEVRAKAADLAQLREFISLNAELLERLKRQLT